MINEYFLCTGVRMDNGEIVIGYVWINSTATRQTYHITDTHGNIFQVLPETVQRVAVKPNKDGAFGKCPNCNTEFNSELILEYGIECCHRCGQRLDWSEADGE